MPSRKFVLTFPRSLVGEPIIYRLVKDHDLVVNILRASVSPDEAGHLVLEITGTEPRIQAGLEYLDRVGVGWQPLSKDVTWREDLCTHCTACVSACPTGALTVERPSMRVRFDEEKCIACELCLPVCSYKAVELHF